MVIGQKVIVKAEVIKTRAALSRYEKPPFTQTQLDAADEKYFDHRYKHGRYKDDVWTVYQRCEIKPATGYYIGWRVVHEGFYGSHPIYEEGYVADNEVYFTHYRTFKVLLIVYSERTSPVTVLPEDVEITE